MTVPYPRKLQSSKGTPKYTVLCQCGHKMRVRKHHFGRMCRCTQCETPIYVTYDNVTPRVGPADRRALRCFDEDSVPMNWEKGDLLMELYEVREKLGQGGFGVVYKVHHRAWGMYIAVKCPNAELLNQDGWTENFEHECETWVNLGVHPNSVRCFYVRRLGGIPRIFVEYVEGDDLYFLVHKRRLYGGAHEESLLRILDIAIQCAWGLGHAHREGVVHQDVKTSNILVATDGAVKVTDFGLARVWRGAGPISTPGAGDGEFTGPRGGTPVYRSPESSAMEEITYRTDIWSWGLCLIEMFAGEIFWSSGEDAMEVLQDLVKNGARYEVVPAIPEEIVSLLEWCFAPSIEDRPDGMHEIVPRLLETYKAIAGKPYDRIEPSPRETSADVLNNRAVSLLDLGKSEESEAIWERLLGTNPGHLESAYNLSLRRWRKGRITDGEFVRQLRGICEENPDGWMPRYLLARVLIECGDCESALKVLQGIPEADARRRDIAFTLSLARESLPDDTRLVQEFRAHSTPITALCISFDGFRVTTGCEAGRIRMWEAAKAKQTAAFDGHEAAVHALCLSENERLLLSAAGDATLRLWQADSGKCLRTMDGHQDAVHAAAISRDGTLALSGGGDCVVKVWNLESGECLHTFEGHDAAVETVALSHNCLYALSGSRDQTIRLWDINHRECLKTVTGNQYPVSALSVRNKLPIALTTSGRYANLWNMETGKLLRRLRGHRGEVMSVSMAEDGLQAISATRTGTLKLWNVQSGQCLRTLSGRAPAAMSRDGRFALSRGEAGKVRLWRLNFGDPRLNAPYMLYHGDAGD